MILGINALLPDSSKNIGGHTSHPTSVKMQESFCKLSCATSQGNESRLRVPTKWIGWTEKCTQLKIFQVLCSRNIKRQT
eukprot:UN25529